MNKLIQKLAIWKATSLLCVRHCTGIKLRNESAHSWEEIQTMALVYP